MRFVLPAVLLAIVGCSSGAAPGGPCTSNRDCVRGETCISGACEHVTKTAPECMNDNDCMLGEYCDPAELKCRSITAPGAPDAAVVEDSSVADSGKLPDPDASVPTDPDASSMPIVCNADPECGSQPANICMSNQCIAGCTEPNGLMCTGGTVCDTTTGHCTNPIPSCMTDAECGAPAQICLNNSCTAGCMANPALCVANEVCNTNTGRCVPVPTTCAMDVECGPPARVCESTQCVPGCASAGGVQCSGATSMCNGSTGRCEAPPGPPPCTLDADCMNATLICVSSVCVPRCDQPAGACSGTNVCNVTDGRCLPGGLALGDTCSIDAQCGTDMCLGLTIGATNVSVCSSACAAASNCPLSFACTSVSGMSFCLGETLFGMPPPSFDTAAGGMCTATVNTCQSGWCNTGTSQCIETCSRVSDCTLYGGNCYTYEQTGTAGSTWDNLCYVPGSGSALGAACTANSGCRSGVCDRYTSVCARQCCSESDCASNETCSVYDLDPTTPLKICIPKTAMAGTGAIGAACTAPSGCESETCVPVDPGNAMSTSACSTLCCTDSDCSVLPGGGRCRPFNGPIMNTLVGACVPN